MVVCVTLLGPVMIGTSIARYDILEELGSGGMSVVYLGRDSALNREVAVKILHEHLAKKPENRARFRREAEAIARLHHHNILDVYDVSSEADDRSFIVMEYIPGQNLRQFIDQHGPPPPEVAALIGVELCNALAHAHSHGVIHRDLKPENVMVADNGDVKLMDFGIAHVIDAETMTKDGSLLGSPAHMAPELIDGQSVDERADVFSLGTVLYWMSTGRLPFCGDNAPQVLRNVMECRFEEPEIVEPKIGHDLARIICKSLQRDPEARFGSIDVIKRELLAAVHAVGIEETDPLRRKYFQDPAGFGQRFEEELVPLLIERGRRALERRNVPSAIAYFNRVLAYDPGNEEVQQCLDKLDQSRRTAKIVGAVAVVALVVGAAWVFMDTADSTLGEGVRDSTANDAVGAAVLQAESATEAFAAVTSAVDDAAGAADRELARSRARSEASRVGLVAETLANVHADSSIRLASVGKIPSPRVLKTAATEAEISEDSEEEADSQEDEPAVHQVDFRVFPASTRLKINGEVIEVWNSKGVKLPEGTHLVTATAPRCEPFSKKLVVNGPRKDKIPVVLKWKEARIHVVANRDVLVFMGDERNVRRSGHRATLPIEFAREQDPERTVKLRIADKANPTNVQVRQVRVMPGDEQTLKVEF
jgi:eukaryotic-like serine/threonine-protein kinase